MYWSLGRLRGWRLEAADGEIGEVSDFLFDDADWAVRWLVVDTGRWLPGRLVLIAPQALREPDEAQRRFPVALTRAQVAGSPDVDGRQPISRQQEVDLHGYWGWWPYWSADAAAAPPPAPAEPSAFHVPLVAGQHVVAHPAI
ncbi:MAG: PRC-barrel domain-containing protein, partial [Alphaproteobacteria bacterium]|nr:PRC-barrel domain-containing protein [Alphaproteobacteria bacterium]